MLGRPVSSFSLERLGSGRVGRPRGLGLGRRRLCRDLSWLRPSSGLAWRRRRGGLAWRRRRGGLGRRRRSGLVWRRRGGDFVGRRRRCPADLGRVRGLGCHRWDALVGRRRRRGDLRRCRMQWHLQNADCGLLTR